MASENIALILRSKLLRENRPAYLQRDIFELSMQWIDMQSSFVKEKYLEDLSMKSIVAVRHRTAYIVCLRLIMNTALLDPFTMNSLPQQVTHTIRIDEGSITQFSPNATLLAIGLRAGTIELYSLDTHDVHRSLFGHISLITSLLFKDDQTLISASVDFNIIIWKDFRRTQTIRFASPVLMISIFEDVIAAIVQGELPIVVGKDGVHSSLSLSEESSRVVASTLAYSPDGYLFIGTNKGQMLVYGADLELLTTNRVTAASVIKQIVFTKSGRELAVNSSDRIIRLYSVDECDIHYETKFQDSIDKTQWQDISFTPDEEYLVGACQNHSKHSIYIWDKASRTLSRNLTAQSGMVHLTMHPSRTILASLSFENLYIWQFIQQQKFSGYEPSFVELEDNQVYREREDEFDFKEEEVKTRAIKDSYVSM